MKFDYSERRLESKNKPHRQPVGMYAAGIFGVILFVFVAGFAGGWFSCMVRMKKVSSLQQSAANSATPSPKPGQEQTLPVAPGGQQTPLTFYKTLPEGGKGVIGSGINANLQEQPAAPVAKPVVQQPMPVHAKPSPVAPPAAKNPETDPPAKIAPAKPAPPAAAASATKPPAPVKAEKPSPVTSEGDRKYTVQVASVRDKAEADSLRNKLAAKGLNPMIFEINVPGKGVVFRVRAGRHMLQSEAQELAAKLGSGSIVITE